MPVKPNTSIVTVVFFSLLFAVRGSLTAESDRIVSPSAKPNRLIHEISPYLLQHAYNPLDWYPWGQAAFDNARREEKPILLSIGYSTCHWCHVMEKESFNNPRIADVMNTYFLSIKVDREERPDLDKIYITAVNALAGPVGWPLNVFLTPDFIAIPPMPNGISPILKKCCVTMLSCW